MDPLGAGKQSKLMAISVVPSFNYTNSKRTSVGGFTLVQTLDNAENTAEKTTFNGQPTYLLDQTTQATCTGDEAGWAGGVKSGTVGKEVKPTSGSSSILVEGKQLVREGDSCTMNNGNVVGKYVAVRAGDIANTSPKKEKEVFDGRIKFVDDNSIPYANISYIAENMNSGEQYSGVTDSDGWTERFFSDTQDMIVVHLDLPWQKVRETCL